ncbi:MAG: SMC-Scp complex subunit ScpB [Bulleidia sp.]
MSEEYTGRVEQLTLDAEIPDEEENNVRNRAILEGLLLITGDEGLTLAQAAQAMNMKEKEVQPLLDALMEYYDSEERGFEVQKSGETYRFLSKQFVHESAKRLFSLEKESRLSNAALETLAIIAYKQPVTRVEIEEIRGVSADVMLRKLEARGLIQESGRSDAPGKPFLYTVTDEFLDSFHLTSLSELPELPQFNMEAGEDLFHQ